MAKKKLSAEDYLFQLMTVQIIKGAEPFIEKYGDDGWKPFVKEHLLFEDAYASFINIEDSMKSWAALDKPNPTISRILWEKYTDLIASGTTPPRFLQQWVLKRLRSILDGENAKNVFNLEFPKGPPVDFMRNLQWALYVKYLRSKNTGMSFEEACQVCGEKYSKDERTISRSIENIIIPDVSLKTLETLSRINLSPLF